ncbi:MAG: hypothetical protein AAF604_04835 [Acidobacteriota bacterium]
MTRRLGFWLAAAAFVVNGPRFVLAYLEAEGEGLAGELVRPLLTASAVSTGVVLTLGGCYLVYVLASTRAEQSSMLRRAVLWCWLLVLGSAVVLLAPVLVSGILRAGLQEVLSSAAWMPWAWALVAVLAPEVVAGGAVAGQMLLARQREHGQGTEEELLEVARERDRLRRHLEELQAAPRALRAVQAPTGEPVPCRHRCGKEFASQRAERAHISYCEDNPANRQEATA